jgi:hypothetical protein
MLKKAVVRCVQHLNIKGASVSSTMIHVVTPINLQGSSIQLLKYFLVVLILFVAT